MCLQAVNKGDQSLVHWHRNIVFFAEPDDGTGVGGALDDGRDEDSRRRSSSRRAGQLRINAIPYGMVYCNDEDLGRTPVEEAVPPGLYDCRVVSPKGIAVSKARAGCLPT